MKIQSSSFDHQRPIPSQLAFGKPDPETHFTFGGNRSPHLAWSEVPEGTRSFALICVDPDVPSVGDDVNQEGRSVPADLPRVEFFHWVMVDIPADVRELAEGAASDGVPARGKDAPAGPAGSRQGVNDYTGWFAGDEAMGGTYLGYDGPAPPWNDERLHHYHFQLFALDVERLELPAEFRASDVRTAMKGHVLAEATWTGTYTMNPALAR